MKIPSKAWIHKSGQMIEIPDEPGFVSEDHGVFAAQNPEKFGMTEDEVKNAVGNPEEYRKLREGRIGWSGSLNKHLNEKGFFRLSRTTENLDKKSKHHNITITHESNGAHPHDFIEPLKTLRTHLENIDLNHSFGVALTGFKSTKTRNEHLEQTGIRIPHGDMVVIGNMERLNKYVGEPGGKRSREPERQPSVPSSSDVRSAIGPKPETMTSAEYNFYRTIGDSYEPCKFATLLEKIGKCKRKKVLSESGGKRILGVNPIQIDTTRELTRHLRKYNSHISVEKSENHNKIIDNRNGAVLHTFTPGSKIGPKAAINVLSAVRDHLQSIRAIEENPKESTSLRQRRQNQTVETPRSAVPERTPEERAERLSRLESIVRERMGEKRSGRIEKAIQRLRGGVRS